MKAKARWFPSSVQKGPSRVGGELHTEKKCVLGNKSRETEASAQAGGAGRC